MSAGHDHALEAAREHFEPLTEVWIAQARSPARSREWLYLGELSAVDGHNRRQHDRGELRRIPVKPRSAEALRAWIKSGPDELNRALEGDLPDDLHWSIEVEEHYPAVPEVGR